ncbi:unnamed protein product [Rotaria sp. Silwood2]|nr:unnamed protein product [Rotaria sp. Silwood2]
MLEPWNDINSYVKSLFYVLDIWPLVYVSILLVKGQNQRLNESVAVLLAMALGGFVVLPYFALHRSDNTRKFKLNLFMRIFDLKFIVILLMLPNVDLIVFALNSGDFHAFLPEFWINQFIYTMTIDLFVVSFLSPCFIADDLERRKIIQNNQFQFYICLSFIPLIEPLIYLYQRQSLQQTIHQSRMNSSMTKLGIHQ